MSTDIYQDAIVTLAKAKHGEGRLDAPDASIVLDNPLCGDRITLDVSVNAGQITAVGHKVRGCMLCEAAASLIGEQAIGTSTAAARTARASLETVLKGDGGPGPDDAWTDVAAFAPVGEYKSRHECVLLPFEALAKAVDEAEG